MRQFNDEYLKSLSQGEHSLIESRISNWGQNDLFFDVLDKWFNNFMTRADKELAFRVFNSIDFYSSDRFQERLREHEPNIIRTVLKTDPAFELSQAIVVYAGEGDSSQRHVYDLTKAWQLPQGRIVRLEELDASTAAPVVIVFNDTHGSGNQFVTEVWPVLEKMCSSSQLFVVCVALAKEAADRLKGLSGRLHIIPACATPGAHELLSSSDVQRLAEIGVQVYPKHPLGYGNCALLTAYYFQCPNNSLPVIWADGTNNATQGRTTYPWSPLFPYRPKVPDRVGGKRSPEAKKRAFDPSMDAGVQAIAALVGALPKSVLDRWLVERLSGATVDVLQEMGFLEEGDQATEAAPTDALHLLYAQHPEMRRAHKELAEFLEKLVETEVPMVLTEAIRQWRLAGDPVRAGRLVVDKQVELFHELSPEVILQLTDDLDVETGQGGEQTEMNWQLVAIRESAKTAHGVRLGLFDYLEAVIPHVVSDDCRLRLAAVSLHAEINRSTNYGNSRFVRLRLTIVDLLSCDVGSDAKAWALSALGRLYLRQGYPDLVVEAAEGLLRLPGADQRLDLQARAWLLKAEAIQHVGDRSNGHEEIDRALKKAWQYLSAMKNPAPHQPLRSAVLRHRAILAATQRRFDEALSFAEAGLVELRNGPVSTPLAWQYHNLADVIARMSIDRKKPPEGKWKPSAACIDALMKSRRIFRSFMKGSATTGSEGVAYSYLMIGRWYAELGDIKRTYKYLKRAKKYSDDYLIANVQREANAELAALAVRLVEREQCLRAH